MSRRRKHIRQVEVAKPEYSGGIVGSFAAKMNLDLKDTNDLMNWIIFGEDAKHYGNALPNSSMTF